MLRGIGAKLARIGRLAVFGVGLLAILALVLGAATTALAAAPGDPLRLGQSNTIDVLTMLLGNRAGTLHQIKNNGGPASA